MSDLVGDAGDGELTRGRSDIRHHPYRQQELSGEPAQTALQFVIGKSRQCRRPSTPALCIRSPTTSMGSGICRISVIAGIPLEEFAFRFAFGMYWSGLYEHLLWCTVGAHTSGFARAECIDRRTKMSQQDGSSTWRAVRKYVFSGLVP